MKIKYSRITLTNIMLLVASFLVFFACNSENSTDPRTSQPEMPPISSMQVDFSTFPESNALPKFTGKNSFNNSEVNENWAWAWLHGVAWKTIISAGMAIPVVAFAESFNHDATQQEDGTWFWEYNFTPLGGVNHTASLYGNVDNDGVNWEMYISKDSFYEDFLWFSGQSNLLGTEGTWIFYNEPNNPTTLFGIEWKHNKDDSTGSIKFTNIIPNSVENGGYIFYGVVLDPTYDAFFDVYDKKKENLVNIKWNRDTHDGRIKDYNRFGDDEWRCWNVSLENVDCN